jgi:HEAT repeat protein
MSSDAGQSFDAAWRLGKLGDMRAVQALLVAARTDEDVLTRVAAAKALGDLKAADAVSALIEMLDDQESLVQQAAEEALENITLRNTGRLRPPEGTPPGEAEKDWAEWWQKNEQQVRRGLGQGR